VEPKLRVLPSWGSVPLQSARASPPPARPFSELAPSKRNQTVPEPAGPPLVGFLLPRTPLRRVPLFRTRFLSVARVGRELPYSRRCRPQGSCPSRRFWQLAARSRTLRPSPVAVAPDALRSSFIPLASLERPSRAFPSRGAVPALAGHFFLAGFAFDCRRRSSPRDLHGRFPRLLVPTLCPFRTRPKADPGRMSRDDGFSRSLVRSPRHAFAYRTYRPLPTDTGLAG